MPSATDPNPVEPPEASRPSVRERLNQAGRVAQERWDNAVARWPWLALPYEFIRRWTGTNATVLAGHLAYRVFIFLIPLIVVVMGVLGYASASGVDLQGSSQSGLHIGAALASSLATTGEEAREGRLQLVVFGGFAVLLAASGLVKALQLVLTLTSELLNMGIDAVALLGLSWVLPRRTEKWFELLPGSILGGIGLGALHIAALVYFPSKIERASALYGTLGIALVALLYLFLMGQVFVASAIANAVWVDRRQILDEAGQAP